MRFVKLKSEEQLDMQILHRARDRLVAERTALINQLRAILLERGIIMSQGRRRLETGLVTLLDADVAPISPRTRILIEDMQDEWGELDRRITAFDEEFKVYSRSDKGPSASDHDPWCRSAERDSFRSGDRQCAGIRPWPGSCRLAWSGASTDDDWRQARLLGISKRGNGYLRKMLIYGARAALPTLSKGQTILGSWLRSLLARTHINKVVVALAAKMARIIWSVLRNETALSWWWWENLLSHKRSRTG